MEQTKQVTIQKTQMYMVIHQGLTQTQAVVYTAGKFGYSINDKDNSTMTIIHASNVDLMNLQQVQ